MERSCERPRRPQPARHNATEALCRRRQLLEAIPPLPAQTQRLPAAVTDPDLDVSDLARVVEHCPPIAARLVGVVRCAFFAQTVAARSVSDAIIGVLGLQLVKKLTTCLVLNGAPRVEDRPGFSPERYGRDTLFTATLALRLSADVTRVKSAEVGSGYLAGLLHNLGVFALIHGRPGAMARVFSAVTRAHEISTKEFELAVLSLTHVEADERLAANRKLPPEIRAVMGHYLDPGYRRIYWPLCTLVRLAETLATSGLDGFKEVDALGDRLDVLGISPTALAAALTRWRAQTDALRELILVRSKGT